MRSKIWAAGLAGVLLASWTALAAAQPSEIEELYRRPEPPRGPPPARAQLFLSPAGQPFRAPPDQPYPVAAWFAEADADGDGRLTRDEFRADAELWFKALDADANGQVGMIEVRRWEEELVPEIARDALGGGMLAAGGPRGKGRKPPGRNEADHRRQGAAVYSLVNEPHPVRGADGDFSMSVSAREWRAATERRFALLDPDGDGVVLASDLKPTPAQVQAASMPEGVSRERRPPPTRARRLSSGG